MRYAFAAYTRDYRLPFQPCCTSIVAPRGVLDRFMATGMKKTGRALLREKGFFSESSLRHHGWRLAALKDSSLHPSVSFDTFESTHRLLLQSIRMCIFNTEVVEVGGTKILVARVEDGRQVTVYRNYVSVEFERSGGRQDVKKLKKAQEKLQGSVQVEATPAMILPFPHKEGDKAVELLDLSEKKFPKTFFGDLEECFPKLGPPKSKSRARSAMAKESRNVLKVVQVGSYNVSVAESLADLHRIDKSVFVVADNVASVLAGHYNDGFGFIIASFRDNEEKHALGYVHNFSPSERLFVPTRHHHHGDTEEEISDWDHQIFSVGAVQIEEAGESVLQRLYRLRGEQTDKQVVQEGRMKEDNVLRHLPIHLAPGDLRCMSKKGRLPNMDHEFSIGVQM